MLLLFQVWEQLWEIVIFCLYIYLFIGYIFMFVYECVYKAHILRLEHNLPESDLSSYHVGSRE